MATSLLLAPGHCSFSIELGSLVCRKPQISRMEAHHTSNLWGCESI